MALFLAVLVSWAAIYGKRTYDIPKYGLVEKVCSIVDVMIATMYPFNNAALFGYLLVTEIIVISILHCLMGREVHRHANKIPKDYLSKTTLR